MTHNIYGTKYYEYVTAVVTLTYSVNKVYVLNII